METANGRQEKSRNFPCTPVCDYPQRRHKMTKAIWKGVILAESDHTKVVEGNHYFPAESVNMEYLQKSDTRSTCPWKGTASYFTIKVNGYSNRDAAWVYPKTSEAARDIANHVAFWRGVSIQD
jgi:uncharacterized protein (DUF427 family)